MAEVEFDNWDDITTVNSQSEGQNLIDSFLNDTAVTADPDEVEPITKETPEKTPEKSEPAKSNPTKTPPPKEINILDALEDDDKSKEGEDEEETDDTSENTKDTKEKEDSEEDNEEQDEDTNPFLAFSQDLVKLGVFEDNGDLPTDGEAFLEKYKSEARKEANSYLHGVLSQFGEDRLQLFNDLILKGVPVQEYLQNYAAVETFSGMDLTKTSNQEKVMRASLRSQGWDSDDIDAEVEKLKEDEDLERSAKIHHKALVKQETKKLQDMSAQAERKIAEQAAYEEQYNKAVNTTLSQALKTKDFEGLPVTPAVAQSVQEDLIAKKYKLPSGELLTEFDKYLLDVQNKPEFFNIKVKMALLAKHNFDLTKVAQKLKTQESSQLFDTVARQTKKTSVKKPKSTEATPSQEDPFMKAFSFLK